MYQEPAVREIPTLDPELDTADPGTLRRAESGGTEQEGKVGLYQILFNKYIFVIVCLPVPHFSFDFTK